MNQLRLARLPERPSDARGAPPGRPTDRDLLSAWRDCGQHRAARALYERHFDAVYRFFRIKAGDPNDIADLASETFARLFHRRSHYPPIVSLDNGAADLRPYLFGIAKRVLYGYIRDRRRVDTPRDPSTLAIVDLLPRSPSSIVVACRELLALTCALRTLPLRDQILIEAKYFDDFSEKDLAVLLEVPYTTIRGRVRDARNHLEKAVHQYIGARRDDGPRDLDDLIASLRREMLKGAARPPE